MPNNCLSVLYKHIIQVENKNVGLKVWGGGGGHKHTIAPPPIKKMGGLKPPCPPPPPPASYASDIYIYIQTIVWPLNRSLLCDSMLLKSKVMLVLITVSLLLWSSFQLVNTLCPICLKYTVVKTRKYFVWMSHSETGLTGTVTNLGALRLLVVTVFTSQYRKQLKVILKINAG